MRSGKSLAPSHRHPTKTETVTTTKGVLRRHHGSTQPASLHGQAWSSAACCACACSSVSARAREGGAPPRQPATAHRRTPRLRPIRRRRPTAGEPSLLHPPRHHRRRATAPTTRRAVRHHHPRSPRRRRRRRQGAEHEHDEPRHVSCLRKTLWVELRGFEPLTPSMPWRCATNCATAPSGTSRMGTALL